MGFDERGRCPMLTDAGCSIYAHRPRTCRTFDCRVFTAAGLSPESPAIAEALMDRESLTAAEVTSILGSTSASASGSVPKRARASR